MISDVPYIIISDVHLGNKNNTIREIIANIDLFFNNYKPRTDKLKIIFIAGDLFDRLLDMSEDGIDELMLWLGRIITYCTFNKIKLRVLEGTPSHDWCQSSKIASIISLLQSDIDYKYIDTLDIEIMKDLDISVLYVPDEWNSDTQVTFNQVRELMQSNGLNKVDIAIMHGQFTYQLPFKAIKAPRHDEASYLSIVKHYIHIGHVHQFSFYERIVAQGSFDRLIHGDEEPKGAVYAIIRDKGEDEYFFIENKLAKTFLTIKIKDMTLEASTDYIEKKLKKLRKGSYIRIKADKNHILYKNFELLKKKFIDFVFTKYNDEEAKEENDADIMAQDIATYNSIVIRRETIEDLLYSAITSKYNLPTESFELIKRHVSEAI